MVLSRNQNLIEYRAQKPEIWNTNSSFFSQNSFHNHLSLAEHWWVPPQKASTSPWEARSSLVMIFISRWRSISDVAWIYVRKLLYMHAWRKATVLAGLSAVAMTLRLPISLWALALLLGKGWCCCGCYLLASFSPQPARGMRIEKGLLQSYTLWHGSSTRLLFGPLHLIIYSNCESQRLALSLVTDKDRIGSWKQHLMAFRGHRLASRPLTRLVANV